MGALTRENTKSITVSTGSNQSRTAKDFMRGIFEAIKSHIAMENGTNGANGTKGTKVAVITGGGGS